MVPIGPIETAGELHDSLSIDGAILVLDMIDALAAGHAKEWEQDEAYATAAPKLGRESTRLDWTQSAEEISNRIRGLYPWPGCRARVLDANGNEMNRVTLVRARPAPLDAAPPAPAGTIDAAGHIAAGRAAVEIIELQPEGKRPMTLEVYCHGHPWKPGMRVESV